MEWQKVPLKAVAPAKAAPRDFQRNQSVWHLNLDSIEADTGNIISRKIAPVDQAGSSTIAFDSGNVLYSKLRPYLNKVVWPQEPGIATSELVPLRPVPGILEPAYLTYYLRSQRFVNFASQFVAGAKMPRVVMKRFWEYRIPLPPLSEQRRIVEILDQADALRKKRAEADKIADRILPALFYKMFGDPATNPKGFVKQELGQLIKIKSGQFLPKKKMNPEGMFPVYGGNGISGYHSEFMFADPVVVVGRVGAYCGVVHYTSPRSWVTDNALFVSELSNQLIPTYLMEALKHANLNQYAGRAGQPLISGNRIYPVQILVPPLEVQQSFEKAKRLMEKQLAYADSSRKKLGCLFSVVLHRAFSGDLTAKWREAHMEELLQEMETQTKALAEPAPRSTGRGRKRRVS